MKDRETLRDISSFYHNTAIKYWGNTSMPGASDKEDAERVEFWRHTHMKIVNKLKRSGYLRLEERSTRNGPVGYIKDTCSPTHGDFVYSLMVHSDPNVTPSDFAVAKFHSYFPEEEIPENVDPRIESVNLPKFIDYVAELFNM